MLEFVLSNGIVNSYIFHCSHSHWMFFNVFKLLSVVSFNCFHVKLFCMGTLIYVCMNNFQLKKIVCVCNGQKCLKLNISMDSRSMNLSQTKTLPLEAFVSRMESHLIP